MTDEPPNITVKSPQLDDDLRKVFDLALDLNYYRSVKDDGGLGHCAWIELRDLVRRLPEAKP